MIAGIKDEVFVEFDKIRQTGRCNMMDRKRVLKMANESEYYNLSSFILDTSRENPRVDREKYYSILDNYKEALNQGIIGKEL